MDTPNGTIDSEQAMQAIRAVNLDELVTETILVKVRCYKKEPVVDDDGEPVCDDDGQPLTYRKASMRTAHIQNIVPVDIYAEALSISQGFQGGMPTKEHINAMGDMVLKIWQISEPFMTRKMLIEEGIDGDVVMALFTRFFDKMNRLQSA
jgi:hypothetical protein